MTFEQLMREHDLIDAITHRLEAACESETPLIDRVIDTRSALKDALDDHLGHEDEAIYQRLMKADQFSAEVVDQFLADFADLKTDWGVYLADWNAECLEADWDGFRRETSELMARVRDRTRAETTLLYPLALRNGAIALREPTLADRRSAQHADQRQVVG